MKSLRLDQSLAKKGLVATRSQAESYIKLGKVKVDGKITKKPGTFIKPDSHLELIEDQYVSRGALKLAGAAGIFNLDFQDMTVLDVGSSTGGFTEFVLKNGARKVIAVDVGSGQMHPKIRSNPKLELHEKTDIRNIKKLSSKPDFVLIDVSFISVKSILPVVSKLISAQTLILAMVKPQFEASKEELNKGIIKNSFIRRRILAEFEIWAKKQFVLIGKADSKVAGEKGNIERFYLLKKNSLT